MIELKNICKTYNSGTLVNALSNVNLHIDDGDFISVMGPSGCGKSTLLNVIGILDDYDSGEYYLDRTLIKNINEEIAAKIRNSKIGFIFQGFNLIENKNSLDNVALPLYYKGCKKKERNMIAIEYMKKVGLENLSHRMPCELSGGQKQRVAIARALVNHPTILLADEPTGSLDSKMSKEIILLLLELNKEGTTILLVTHEQELGAVAKRQFYMVDGHLYKL